MVPPCLDWSTVGFAFGTTTFRVLHSKAVVVVPAPPARCVGSYAQDPYSCRKCRAYRGGQPSGLAEASWRTPPQDMELGRLLAVRVRVWSLPYRVRSLEDVDLPARSHKAGGFVENMSCHESIRLEMRDRLSQALRFYSRLLDARL